jgi:hypothetical protein
MNKKPRLALSQLLLAPIFLGFTLNGWRIRILPPERRSIGIRRAGWMAA